jgi:assimilatory nitrate reductase catalytic subunit
VNPVVDPVSGEPEFKHTPAAVEPFHVAWHGFVLTRQRLDLTDVTWWSLARSEHCFRYEIAGRTSPADWPIQTRKLLGATHGTADFLDYHDPAAQTYRAAYLVNDRLEACAFFSARPNLPSKTWLSTLFAAESLGVRDRAALLAGALPDAKADAGPIVCSCFSVGRNTIRDCITNQSLTTPRQVGERLRAGTNCGSCIPELRLLLAEVTSRSA